MASCEVMYKKIMADLLKHLVREMESISPRPRVIRLGAHTGVCNSWGTVCAIAGVLLEDKAASSTV